MPSALGPSSFVYRHSSEIRVGRHSAHTVSTVVLVSVVARVSRRSAPERAQDRTGHLHTSTRLQQLGYARALAQLPVHHEHHDEYQGSA